jgi:ribosomal protein S18 acetylase RimI-like enzyme
MMAAAEDWLRAAGISKLQLLVRRENEAANAFYGSLGFELSTSVMFQKWLDGRTPT